MRSSYVATLGVASLFALGCVDSSSNAPTDPGLEIRATHSTTSACVSADSRTAQAQLKNMLAGDNLKQAQTRWAAVEAACSNTAHDNANGALMSYVAYLRSLYPAGFVAPKAPATKESNFLGHLNTIFPYVGYAAPNLPGGAAGPLEGGVLAVITQTSVIREYQRAYLGAFMLPVQDSAGDARGHLFAMHATNAQCLSVDNLDELSNCVQVSSFPAATPKFSPGIKVGICIPEGLTAGALVLGHETSGGTEVAGQAAYPGNCHVSVNVASTSTPFQNALNQLASFGRRTFGIRSAYATDKGLGGIGSTLSGWGALDALVFATSFGYPHVVGEPPKDTVGKFVFTQTATAPGSILVQNSLGNYTGPLVVLTQGGGACTNCGGLELRAHLYSASGNAADDGVYEVNWKSLNASPSIKGGPFVLRGGDGSEVARLTYLTLQGANILQYNGVPVGSWVRNEVQSFKIIVDLNTNMTTLSINGNVVAGPVAFVDGGQTFASLAAEFSGIDSGVMGWDEIGIQRISDQPTP